MSRKSWTMLRKMRVFEAHKGICHLCGGKIDGTREAWELEHIIPIAMGGADDETNVAPAHVSCHKGKTATDKAQIAKANRVRAKHNAARAGPKRLIPGSKGTGIRKKVNGGTERRTDE